MLFVKGKYHCKWFYVNHLPSWNERKHKMPVAQAPGISFWKKYVVGKPDSKNYDSRLNALKEKERGITERAKEMLEDERFKHEEIERTIYLALVPVEALGFSSTVYRPEVHAKILTTPILPLECCPHEVALHISLDEEDETETKLFDRDRVLHIFHEPIMLARPALFVVGRQDGRKTLAAASGDKKFLYYPHDKVVVKLRDKSNF